jgi:uncharacterized protein YndB with AHSA1/START domain
MSNAIDWTRFEVRINVKAPIQDLYDAWATRKGIERWFLRLSEYKKPDGSSCGMEESVKKGDTYKWLWYGYPDSTVEHGEILAVNCKDEFKFSFGKAGNCTVRIFPEDDEAIVELVQDSIPTDDKGKLNYYVGCKGGWTFYLANLKSLFEGGIDLRNRKIRVQEMLNS